MAKKGWSSQELELADDVLVGPILDASFFNKNVSLEQRRSILGTQANDTAVSAEALVQSVDEERIDRVWETPGQAAVRTLLVLFDSATGSGRPRRRKEQPKVTSSRTRKWKHLGELTATGSTVTTNVRAIPNVGVVIGKSVTVPHEIAGSRAKADARKKSFSSEAAFFKTVPHLLARSVAVPKVYFSSADAENSSFIFVLEDLRKRFPEQHSGFTLQHARVALSWLARFHATFWEERLPFSGTWDEGTFWNLAKRPIESGGSNEAQTKKNHQHQIRENWKLSVCELELEAEVHGVCEVLLANAEWLDEQLSAREGDPETGQARKRQRTEEILADPTAGARPQATPRRGARCVQHRTLLHGDFKAENIVFSAAADACAAVDFQWCGAGYPARDVMYLLCSASCDKVRRGNWEELLRFYYAALEREVRAVMREDSDGAREGGGAESAERGESGADDGGADDEAEAWAWAWDYSWEEFERHWRLALCDFVRFCVADGPLIKDDFNDDSWLVRQAASAARLLGLDARGPPPSSWSSL